MEAQRIDEPTKPGQYLAYEREKRGLTIEDVARELHLSTHVLRALEEEAYDKLPELVYVRGYIRLYCRLLRIDPVPVLDMYTENLPKVEDQLLEDLSLSSPVNERQQRLIMIWGSVGVASIFLILIIGWWQENQQATSSLNGFSAAQEDNVTLSDVKDIEISDSPPKQAATPSASDVDTVPAEPSPLPLLEPIEIRIRKTDERAVALDEYMHSALPNAEADNGLANSQFNAIDNTLQPVTLVIMASGESWARVRDGSGDIFIHRILPAEYNKIFMVNLPLKFELGNAYRVSIMIEGKDYDFSPYIKPNRVATFEVSELP